ncbi:MAG: hypothetical protein JW969_08080 [Spirochaetales bacterium]|nr:hypothetical protein [Spirochaetales bacterium]
MVINYNNKIVTALFLLFFITGGLGLWGQQDKGILSKGQYNYETGMYSIDITIASSEPLKADSRFNLETRVEEQIDEIFLNNISGLIVDSSNILKDRFKDDMSLVHKMKVLAQSGTKTYSRFSRDKKSVTIRYAFSFFGDNGLLSLLVMHERPVPIRHFIGFAPTKKFSGLVIYAKGEYPVFGTNQTGKLQPAVFFRIFDENMDLVLNRQMCDPGFLRKWGMAEYSMEWDEKGTTARVGAFPYYTMASMIFGRHTTDIILPQDVVEKLLSIDENLNLLKEGRILIILDDLELTVSNP